MRFRGAHPDDQLELSLPAGERPAPRKARASRGPKPRSGRATAPQLDLPLVGQPAPLAKPSLRGQARLETALRFAIGPRVMITLTENRSTMISATHRRGVLYVRIHAIFCDAPDEVLEAVATYVSASRIGKRKAALIDDWIELHRERVKPPARKRPLQPVGEVHDLGEMFERLNREFFEGRLTARITWSRAIRRKRRQSIRMGSYSDEENLIRIHPALDQDFVPAYFVELVVFHEMLHEVHDAEERDNGKRCIHTDRFLEDEQRHPEYERARRWERRNLTRLLHY